MKVRPNKYWKSCCRRAFTLVEVVASLMLLGTLLVGILVAHRRHAEQIRGAAARLEAVEAAEKLFAEWSEKGIWGAAEPTGRFKEQPQLAWRWSVLPSTQLRRFGVAIGRLEIVSTVRQDIRPLVQVDVLTTAGTVVP